MAYIRCSDEIHARLKVAAAKLQRPMQEIAEELLLQFVEVAEHPKPVVDVIRLAENRTDDLAGGVLKGVSSNGTGTDDSEEWEYRALGEILDSGYGVPKEAIQKNLTAFRELVRRIREDERARGTNAGPERLPGGEVEEVHRRVGEHEQTYAIEKENLPRPSNPRKRKRNPAEGTA